MEVKKVFARLQELTVKWNEVHGQEETSRVGEKDNASQSILYRAGFWTIMTITMITSLESGADVSDY